MGRLLISFSLLILALPAAAEEPATVDLAPSASFDSGHTFVTANTAYEEGDYGRASQLYSELVAHGFASGLVHYNLGNACLRGGELGRAIAAYRRGLAERPRDQDLQANLEFARRTAKDAIDPPRPSALMATLLFWHYSLSRVELASAALALNLLLWSLLALRLLRLRDSEVLRWGVPVVALLLVAILGSLLAHAVSPARVAVVVPGEVEVVSGPGRDAVVRFKLHAGTEVAVRDLRDDFARIALPDGQQGWLPLSQVELVEP